MNKLRTWLRYQRRGELQAYGLLIALALALRLFDLADRPYHHDESQDAYFSWRLFSAGEYEYDPLLHGPLRFYLTALVYLVAGVSDFTARLAPALLGTGMVALAWGLRPVLGRVAALIVAIALAVGPSYLYFSRFAREDIYIAFVTLALLVAVFRFLQRPAPWQPAVIGALLAASFAVKESTFITAFVFGTFLLAWLARDALRRDHHLARRLALVGWEAWVWAVVAFVAVQTLLFTTFFVHPDHWDALYEGLDYWLGQHEVGRGGEAWFFYIVVLALEEWPAVLLGAIGAVVALRDPTPLRVFALWGFVVSLAVYSWAGEKFSWLVLHPLLPLLLLAGLAVQAIWDRRADMIGKAGLLLVALCAAYVVFASWQVNAQHRADPRELLVSTQSSEQVVDVRDQVSRLSERVERRQGQPPSIRVDSAQGATYPWAWYFRTADDVQFLDYSVDTSAALGDVMILTEQSYQRLRPQLDGYEARQLPFRVWWVRDYDRLTPATALQWIVKREPWSETGGMPEWLLVRSEITR